MSKTSFKDIGALFLAQYGLKPSEQEQGIALSGVDLPVESVNIPVITRRKALRDLSRFSGVLMVLGAAPALAAKTAKAGKVVAVRLWPADEYSRVTIETGSKVEFKQFLLPSPDRLVVDMKGVRLNHVLSSLGKKLISEDPYIRKIRVGQFKPSVVRLVMELKQEISPQIFALKPIGNYGHRLVLDLYAKKNSVLITADSNKKLPTLDDVLAQQSQGVELKTKPENTKVSSADKNEQPVAPAVHTNRRSQAHPIITLDAGHGGEDPGAQGHSGTLEKNIVLSVARLLKKRLEENNGKVVLTRSGDYFVPLGSRVKRARKARADLFVSIHADSWTSPKARGSSVFVLSETGASSAAARLLAKRENDADLIGGVNVKTRNRDLAKTLLDLSQTATLQDSLKLADAVLGRLGGINRLHSSNIQKAGFAVLKAPDIPSILVETAFISNPHEERRLKDKHFQEKLADALTKGIYRYWKVSQS